MNDNCIYEIKNAQNKILGISDRVLSDQNIEIQSKKLVHRITK